MRSNDVRVVLSLLVLTFAWLVCAQRQRPQQRPTDQPFVDEYREYYPEDDKFYFNYTFGDASKRVYFRSANAGNGDLNINNNNINGNNNNNALNNNNNNNALNNNNNFNSNSNRRPTSGGSGGTPSRRPSKPTYVADIDTPYSNNQGADGYNYDRPTNQLSYDRPGSNNNNRNNNNNNRGVYKRASRLPYKVDFRMFRDERF